MWPFRRRRASVQAEVELPGELAAIGDDTPTRFSIVFRDAAEVDAAREELAERLGAEVSVERRRRETRDNAMGRGRTPTHCL